MIPFKICCMRSTEEADAAIAAGALAIGLVGAMPNGPGTIDDELIRDIASHVHARHGERVWTTLLTCETEGEAIADYVEATRVNTVQIVDAPAAGAYAHLRRAHPALRIMQVIHVEDERALDEARAVSVHIDAILLDSGKPSAAVRTLGGTGDIHDWAISRRIVDACGAPVFLAGGLNPSNVVEAVRRVRPYGVDLCTGLRDKERGYALEADKLAAFAAALREASLKH